MHISTHHDRIWHSNCQQKENNIAAELRQSACECDVQLVDAVIVDQQVLKVITDSVFTESVPFDVVSVIPEFWSIYHCDQLPPEQKVVHHVACMMNRISGERLMLFYKLAERDLIDSNAISFNCLYHDRDPDQTQRQANFSQIHLQCGWNQWNDLHDQLKPRMPWTCELDPDQAAMSSKITVVVETYNSDSVIVFSEKIFRALQTPRPWVLCTSPGAVKLLKDHGFDVLDDCVDHSYDCVLDQSKRMDVMLDSAVSFDSADYERYIIAARHNQQHLAKLQQQWPDRLNGILHG
jgi:hypothetical protein